MLKPCVHIELSIGFYGNYKRFKKKIAKERSKKSSPKILLYPMDQNFWRIYGSGSKTRRKGTGAGSKIET